MLTWPDGSKRPATAAECELIEALSRNQVLIEEKDRFNLKVTPWRGFDLHIGAHTIPDFRMISGWHGMVQLRDGKGRTVLLLVDESPNPLNRAVEDLLGDPQRRARVIKASPDLLAEMCRKEEKHG